MELREELRRIDDAIVALESLAASKGASKRGRPPGWLVKARKRREQRKKAAKALQGPFLGRGGGRDPC